MNEKDWVLISLQRPVIIWDGECEFCGEWIRRWERITSKNVEYIPFGHLQGLFPETLHSLFERAVVLIEPSGRVLSGADAIFHILEMSAGKRNLISFLRRLPGFLQLSRLTYRFVASHRGQISFVSRLWRQCREGVGSAR